MQLPGVYELQHGRMINGHPAWKSMGMAVWIGLAIHEEKMKKWITRTTAGNWIAQPEADLGTTTGLLVLRDTTCADPTESTVLWEWTNTDGGCGEWVADLELICGGTTAADLAEKNAERETYEEKLLQKQRESDAKLPALKAHVPSEPRRPVAGGGGRRRYRTAQAAAHEDARRRLCGRGLLRHCVFAATASRAP